MRDYSFPLPPLPEQRAIAHILGTLDDKIELNRKMNETLEGIARALFKSWFVDFDPVRAKMDGKKPAGMDDETAELFPDELVWNEELGKEVPKGWEVGKVGEVMELAYGKSLPERKRQSGHVNVFGSNGIVGNHNEKLVDGPGIIIGRKGTAGTIIWSHSDFFPIDTTFYIVAKNHIMSLLYLYHELHAQDLPHLISDSAVPGLNRNIVYMNRIVIPPTFLINKFDLIVAPFFSQMNVKNEENNKLENTRDTLLPKLISGQIRINDPEQFLNERGIEN